MFTAVNQHHHRGRPSIRTSLPQHRPLTAEARLPVAVDAPDDALAPHQGRRIGMFAGRRHRRYPRLPSTSPTTQPAATLLPLLTTVAEKGVHLCGAAPCATGPGSRRATTVPRRGCSHATKTPLLPPRDVRRHAGPPRSAARRHARHAVDRAQHDPSQEAAVTTLVVGRPPAHTPPPQPHDNRCRGPSRILRRITACAASPSAPTTDRRRSNHGRAGSVRGGAGSAPAAAADAMAGGARRTAPPPWRGCSRTKRPRRRRPGGPCGIPGSGGEVETGGGGAGGAATASPESP